MGLFLGCLFIMFHSYMCLFFHFFYCLITVVPIFPPLPSLALLIPHLPHSVFPLPHCLYPWWLYTCSLTWPFPFFTPLSSSLLPSGHCQFILYFNDSSSILLVCFVDYVPLLGEIIWYLSFTTWVISLSIMLSSSIHAVAKCRSSFFLLHSIPLCKCTIVFWYPHLLVDT